MLKYRLSLVPLILAILVFAAHFIRFGQWGLATAILGSLFLLFDHRRFIPHLFAGFAVFIALYFINMIPELVAIRKLQGLPYTRLAVIIGSVSGVSLLGGTLMRTTRVKNRFGRQLHLAPWQTGLFLLTLLLLVMINIKVPRPMLLAERFFKGGGFVEALLLARLSVFLFEKLADSKKSARWRKRIWIGFALVFFGQLAIGLAGEKQFLMTGTLHVPVPAVIVGGPLYRSEGFFMPILLGITLLLVGPAWCSHLCYFGPFDLLAAKTRKKPTALPKWTAYGRLVTLLATVSTALGLAAADIGGTTAALIGIGFGVIGLIVMFVLSRKQGAMVHCTAVCPIGLLAATFGKISPFRVKFKNSCDGCGACGRACTMGALEKSHIQNRKPGFNCTLCGDCVGRCNKGSLSFSFGPWQGEGAKKAFLLIICALYTVFLAVARV